MGNGQTWVYPPTFQTKGGAPRYRHRLSPVLILTTPNLILTRRQNAHGLCKAWASTFANLRPRRRTKQGRRKEGPHTIPLFVRQPRGYTHRLLLSLSSPPLCPLFRPFSPTSVRSIPTFDHSPPLKSHPPRHRTAEHPRRP